MHRGRLVTKIQRCTTKHHDNSGSFTLSVKGLITSFYNTASSQPCFMSQKPLKTLEKYATLCYGMSDCAMESTCRFSIRPLPLPSHYNSLAKHGLTWNQMALTILLRTNRGRTQRALKTEVRMNSNQDHTLPWREGSPGAKNSLLTLWINHKTNREPAPPDS